MQLRKPSPRFGETHFYTQIKEPSGKSVWKLCDESTNSFEAWLIMVQTVPSRFTTNEYFGYAIFRKQKQTITDFDALPIGIQDDLLNRISRLNKNLNDVE